MDDRQAFLAAIGTKPLDHLLRCVFADWLDEHGEVEEATRQREWVGAYEYLLKNFVHPYEEDDYVDDEREEVPPPGAAIDEINYWQQSLVEQGGVCFGTDQAAQNTYDDAGRNEFCRNLEIVTGTKISSEIRDRAAFRCAC